MTHTLPARTSSSDDRSIETASADAAVPAERGRPGAWRAHWIGPETRADLERTAQTPTSTAASRPFSRTMFRKTVRLDQVPATAPVRLSADSRYVLWVNGHEVSRGPARSQPYRQRYDAVDVAALLLPGDNVLAVLVTYYGEPTSFWQPPGVGSSRDAVLVLEADLGGESVITDESWRTRRSDAWSLAARHDGMDGVPVEIVDARRLERGWLDCDFDDSSWVPATLVATTHIGGLARTRPPTYPFGALRPRGISFLVGDWQTPARVLDCSTRRRPDWDGDHPAVRAVQGLLEAPLSAQVPCLPARFMVTPDTIQHLGVDFGRIVAGHVEIALTAPAGTVVEIYYREKLFRPDRAHLGEDPATGARYTAAGDGDIFAAVEVQGLRYLHCVIHHPTDAADSDEDAESETEVQVTVDSIRVREHLYPRTGRASFDCDDERLTRLYRAGVRTVQLNSFDSYIDCPTREQRAWVGDGVVHQQVDLTTNEDWGLARNYTLLCDSPRSDGMLPMAVVGDLEDDHGLTIPDWALSWVHGVHVQYRYDGDVDAVRDRLPTIARVVAWFCDYVDTHGTLADVPEWTLVDWSSLFLSGRSSILTAMWVRALTEYAALCEAVGDHGAARWAGKHVDAARRGFEDFYDPARGLYVDHIVDGRRRPAASQPTNALAIVTGLAPRERWTHIVEKITDSSRLVVRSWVGSATGGYDQEKIRAQARGVQEADWDVDHEIVLAEPFFSYAVHDAVALAGHADLLPDLLLRWEEFLQDGYDTLGECWGWGTPVHGWSSTPSRDLVAYVLGVTPDEPGYGRVRVAPRLGRLKAASGAVPTPHGYVDVTVRGAQLTLTTPVPATVVTADGTRVDVPAGRHGLRIR